MNLLLPQTDLEEPRFGSRIKATSAFAPEIPKRILVSACQRGLGVAAPMKDHVHDDNPSDVIGTLEAPGCANQNDLRHIANSMG